MAIPVQLGGIVGLFASYGEGLAVVVWIAYQMYWPLWDTKAQTWFGSVQTRLATIETVQIALASSITTIDETHVQDLHDRNGLEPSDVIQPRDSTENYRSEE